MWCRETCTGVGGPLWVCPGPPLLSRACFHPFYVSLGELQPLPAPQDRPQLQQERQAEELEAPSSSAAEQSGPRGGSREPCSPGSCSDRLTLLGVKGKG